MRKRIFIWGGMAALLLGLSACGGGGSSSSSTSNDGAEMVTGVFVDSPVAGIDYTCSSGDFGLTNAAGEFTCPSGDSVEFFLGGYSLGSCDVDEIVSPFDLYPESEAAAANVAQLLQTVDADGDPSNGITIPEDFSELDETSVLPTSPDFDQEIAADLGEPLVDETDALDHLNGTVLTTLLAGQTFYTTIYDQTGTLEQWVINADATSATWTELVGGSESGTVSLTIEGMSFTATDSEGSSTMTVDVVTDTYLDVSGDPGTPDRLYFDRTAAEDYFQVDIEPLVSILAGQTFYTTIYDQTGTLEQWVINADATSATWTELVGGSDSGTVSMTLDGMSFVVTDNEGAMALTVDVVTDTYLDVSGDTGAPDRLYFDRTVAEDYFQVAIEPLLSILAGQTFYTTLYDQTGTLEKWVFNADATSATWTELVGGSDSGIVSTALDGMSFIVTDSEGAMTLTVDVVTDTYLDVSGDAGSPDRLYFDRAAAEDYFQVEDLSASILGGWRISGTGDDFLAINFYADGTYAHMEMDQDDTTEISGMEWGTYSIDETTGLVTVTQTVDYNGDTGLTGFVGTPDVYVDIAGDVATLSIDSDGDGIIDELITASRIESNGVLGSWRIFSTPDDFLAFNFYADGTYAHMEVDQDDATEISGMEWGTYSIDETTGLMTVTQTVDYNGDTGLTDFVGTPDLYVDVAGDVAILSIDSDGDGIIDELITAERQ